MGLRRRACVLASVTVGLTALAIAVRLVAIARPRSVSGPLAQGAYVWQRQWGEPVTAALARAAGPTQGFTALAAEVSWRGDRARVVRVHPDCAALKATRRPVGLALRLGVCRGPFDARAEPARLIASLAGELIREARAGGLEPAELQVDFDAAASQLRGYREWIRALRAATGAVPLTITALPSWLREPAFAALARATDGYVLQVHSLEPPPGPEATMALCDPEAARRWVKEAGRIGVPFRVALPTYSYLVAFDARGKLVGASAEGPSLAWRKPVTLRVVRADAAAMARLVQGWQRARPAAMQGLLWYRLPVAGDRLNWQWATLAAVMTGTAPRAEPRLEVTYPEPELAEITLANGGLADLSPPARVQVVWGSGEVLGADGLRGYQARQTSATELQLDQEEEPGVLPPGERWQIGWLRFRRQTEVHAHVTTSLP